jgi:hypothetical protein
VLSLVDPRNIMSESISNRRRYQSQPDTPTEGNTPSNLPSPSPELVARLDKARRENEQYFRDLIEMGGRPAFPSIEIFYSPVGTRGEYEDIIDF